MASLPSAILVAFALLPLAGEAAAPASGRGGEMAMAAGSACRQAVSLSRMVCVTGADCQQEISPVLRSCNQAEGACRAAQDELREQCGRQLPWYGSRECNAALREVSHYCARDP